MLDLEHREQALVRKCEDLRHSLSEKTKELSRSQELYSKLKQRVLLDRPPGSAIVGNSSHLRAPTPNSPNVREGPIHPGAYGRQPHIPGQSAPIAGGAPAPDYFPASPRYTKAQTGPATLVGWTRQMAPHGRGIPVSNRPMFT